MKQIPVEELEQAFSSLLETPEPVELLCPQGSFILLREEDYWAMMEEFYMKPPEE